MDNKTRRQYVEELNIYMINLLQREMKYSYKDLLTFATELTCFEYYCLEIYCKHGILLSD